MAALYYKHERAETISDTCGCTGTYWVFQIPQHYQVDDWWYLCVVHEGRVYAGRKIFTSKIGYNAMHCIAYDDTETGRQILLKHFLLGD